MYIINLLFKLKICKVFKVDYASCSLLACMHALFAGALQIASYSYSIYVKLCHLLIYTFTLHVSLSLTQDRKIHDVPY